MRQSLSYFKGILGSKKSSISFLFLLLISISTPIQAAAKSHTATQSQQTHTSITETFILYYWQDKIDLDPEYLDNKAQFEHINDYLARSPQIDSIVIYSSASPEGVYERNAWLANRRAIAARDYILSQLSKQSTLTKENIILRPIAENWDGLYQEVLSSYFRADRDKVLSIITNSKIGNDTKKWRIKQLDNGNSWRYLIRHQMPKLRMATWVCVWESPDPIEPEAPELPVLEEIELPEDDLMVEDEIITFESTAIEVIPLKEKVTIFALKTNLLYDVATALNAEIEVPIGKHFSIMVEDVFPWWAWGPNDKKFAFQLWSMGVEPRWWFARTKSRDVLSGQFIAPYIMTAMGDVQDNYDLCYQFEYWSAGISYGLAVPIGKIFNLEFSASLGYLEADYRHYQPDTAYEHLYKDKFKVGTLSFFGPTKLKISLVLPITIWRRAR